MKTTLTIAIAGALALGGCSSGSNSTPSEPSHLSVEATCAQLYTGDYADAAEAPADWHPAIQDITERAQQAQTMDEAYAIGLEIIALCGEPTS